MNGIQYSLTLHLREVQELGIDINLVDLCIFEFLRSFETKSYCQKEKLDDGNIYFWVSHDLIIQQLPLLGIKSKRNIIAHVNKLVKSGLLIRYKNTQGVSKSYYRFGALADKIDNGFPSDEIITPPLTKSSHPSDEIITPPLTKSSHNNIQDITEQEYNIIPPLSPDGEISTNKGEKKKPKDVVEDFIEISVEESFKPIMRDWCAYKREKGQSYKPTGLKACYAKLLKLSNSNSDTARQIIEQSMASNWAGLFALKSGYAKKEPIGIILRNNTDDKYLNQKIKQWK
ncbi:hypothetical protein ABVC71_07885 [Prevotella amnii]|uniref:hypothetical protein n=1 Tax=Prevotella amnii TaxID=419005 RepID=UPI00336A7A97